MSQSDWIQVAIITLAVCGTVPFAWNARVPLKKPSREEFNLGLARKAYFDGHLEIEEFEKSMAHVLGGGWLKPDGTIPAEGEEIDPILFLAADSDLVYAKVIITEPATSQFPIPQMEER